jgi:hypothetical protein
LGNVPSPSGLGKAQLPEESKLRFVVGIFAGWPQLWTALCDLRVRGHVLDSFNCIALQRLFTNEIIKAPEHESVAIQPMPFPGIEEQIACTVGPLSRRLIERVQSGASSLKDALGCGLIPRHAVHFEKAVLAGKILFWIRVSEADDERRVHQSLFTHSSNSVGVHDLVPTSK